MRIGIDCRIWGSKHGGVGRYVQKLVENLYEIDKKNNYVVFCGKEDYAFIPEGKNWKKVVADIPHYSLREQLVLPFIFLKEKVDVLYVPHFNVPVFYTRAYVVAIHDLLWHERIYPEDTTHSLPVYLVKYLSYRLVSWLAILRSKKIFVPTNFVASDIVRRFKLSRDKLVVSYGAGIKEKIPNSKFQIPNVRKPYILYVGSLAPHKNTSMLVEAFCLLKKHDDMGQLSLVIAARKDRRYQDLLERIGKFGLENSVYVTDFVDDCNLDYLYKNSEALVFPTLFEGFGMPGVEAMGRGIPVVCSDIEVLREVYGEAALYFDPRDPRDMAEKIHRIISDKKMAQGLVNKGRVRVKLYSWEKMAKEVLGVITSIW